MESRCLFIAIGPEPVVAWRDPDLVDPSVSSSRTLTRSARALGRFLPTWSARIGQLAVAAVDEHGEPHVAGPAEVVERVERGADGAAGEEHVVDEDDDLAVDAAGRHRRLVRAAGGLLAQVVAVHRDVERRRRRPARPRPWRSARRPAGEWTPRVCRPSRTRSSRPLLRSRISWEMRVSAREMSRASRTVRSVVARVAPQGRSVQMRDGQAATAPDLLLRLTGRLVKGCRSGPTVAAGQASRTTGAALWTCRPRGHSGIGGPTTSSP